MLTIGLTGGIACGKSLVSGYFKQLGKPIIDTDIIARELVEPGKPALHEIIQIFGEKIIDNNSKLNRKLLREIIFESPSKRLQLEAILHPKIHSVVLENLTSLNKKNTPPPYCIIVIPLLFETKSSYPIDRVLLVDCTEQQQIERTMKRDKITREQSLAIIQNQTSRTERLKRSDDIIENTTNPDFCRSQLDKMHKKYMSLSKNK
ncbi:MAG: dephospho-CoA kinase [Gammaproteobacteria bacterium]